MVDLTPADEVGRMDRPEYIGKKYEIRSVVLADGSCPVGEFLASLQPEDKRNIRLLVEMLADQGRISNPEKYNEIDPITGVFTISHRKVVVWGFLKAPAVYLLFGAKKEKQRNPSSDAKRAKGYRDWFLTQLGDAP
jgi:hypothetical protein